MTSKSTKLTYQEWQFICKQFGCIIHTDIYGYFASAYLNDDVISKFNPLENLTSKNGWNAVCDEIYTATAAEPLYKLQFNGWTNYASTKTEERLVRFLNEATENLQNRFKKAKAQKILSICKENFTEDV